METKHFELIVEKHSANPKNTLRNVGKLREAAKDALVVAIDHSAPDDDVEANLLREELNTQLSNVLFWVTRCAIDNGTNIAELMRNEFGILAARSGINKCNYTK